jgi:hypothetical protein
MRIKKGNACWQSHNHLQVFPSDLRFTISSLPSSTSEQSRASYSQQEVAKFVRPQVDSIIRIKKLVGDTFAHIILSYKLRKTKT